MREEIFLEDKKKIGERHMSEVEMFPTIIYAENKQEEKKRREGNNFQKWRKIGKERTNMMIIMVFSGE